jgi:hypothetical protein
MKNTLKLILTSIRRWIRSNVIADGWQDERGFHYGTPDSTTEKSEK